MERKGFSLIELMIVVLILGVIAAMAVPNLLRMRGRAQEAAVKSNMHVIQIAAEDFAVLSDGRYPDNASDTANQGSTLEELVPGGVYPENPFTALSSVVQWDADPTSGKPGEVAFNPATPDSYNLKANGLTGTPLPMVLVMGQ